MFIIHWFKHAAFTFTRAEGELGGVLLGAAADVSGHGPGPHPNHQTGHCVMMSSRHTPCHVSPGEVRVADCADVGVVEHADVPLVAGLVVADEAVLVPDVGGQTSLGVVQQSVLQVKLGPEVSRYNVNVIMTSILYSIPFTQPQQFELSVDL